MSYVSNLTSDFVVYFPSDEIDATIASDRISIGGTVQTLAPANTAHVTEHAFLALETDEEVVLFDNSDTGIIADHQLVVFDSPMHDVTAAGLTKHKGNCNYAIVSGTGKLTGKRYTHTTAVMSATNKETDEDERLKQVTDNCLINEINSRNVAERVLAYFGATEQIRSKLMLTTERPGDLIQFRNPFKELTEAHIEKMDVLATALLGANCEMIKGFNPQYSGNDFNNSIIIDKDGTWTVPENVTYIKVVLIGGGQGGQGGAWGQNGADYYDHSMSDSVYENSLGYYTWVGAYSAQPIRDGGAAGAPGSPGAIFATYLNVTPGDVLTFDIGAGGAGGEKGTLNLSGPGELGSLGALGEHTTMSLSGETYTTEDGSISTTGYLYLFGQRIFGKTGEAGHKGGAGGQTNTTSLNGWQAANGLQGGSVGKWTGGKGGKGISKKWWNVGPEEEVCYNVASGGGGGGAAWGENGKATYYRDYPAGTFTNSPEFYGGSNYSVRAAFGGDGANAHKPDIPDYGCGGGGGNGGGSGGNAGGGKVNNKQTDDVFTAPFLTLEQGGNAGSGSDGGNGGNGCAIIYY